MVTQEELTHGARLIQELDQGGFPITTAFWAYDPLLSTWRFIIAAPRHAIESLVGAYGVIQDIIREKDLRITLDRVSLIPDNDAKLENLQALAKSDTSDVVEVSVGRAEIAGRVLDDIHLYKGDVLRYEREVLQHLQLVQPSDMIRRTYFHTDFPKFLEADALLDDGSRLIIVEAKMQNRPVDIKAVFQVEGMLRASETYFGRLAAAMIVSRNGFTDQATAIASRNPRIRLVQWIGPQDDDKLRQAVDELRRTDRHGEAGK